MTEPRPAARRPAPPGRPAAFQPDFLTTLFRFPLDPGYADAAAARRERGPRPPLARHATAGLAAVVACLIGLLFAVAYRKTVSDQPGRARVRTGLVGQIDTLRDKTDEMQLRATALRDEVERLRRVGAAPQPPALAALAATAARTAVTGAGVVVSVADPQGGGVDPRARIQDRDLRGLVNAVWAAGAEAVSVNDVRLTATSTIRTAGRSIQLDAVPIRSPYWIRAVGGPGLRAAYLATLEAKVMRSLAARYAMEYTVVEDDELTLPAAREPTLRHARPLRPAASASPSGGTR